jgi:hypothetical protein
MLLGGCLSEDLACASKRHLSWRPVSALLLLSATTKLLDFNPIKLSFSVLKAWFQRNYVWTRSNYRSFGDYLVWAIGQSRCHAAGGHYLERELKRFREWLRVWERETAEIGAEDWVEEELEEAEEGAEHKEEDRLADQQV